MPGPVISAVESLLLSFATNHVAAQANVSPAVANAAVSQAVATSGHPVLSWLQNGGFNELLQLAIQLAPTVIPLIAAGSAS